VITQTQIESENNEVTTMKTYTVVLMYFDGEHPVEVVDSPDLIPMLRLAGLICRHAIADVSSVEIWEADWAGVTQVVFFWSSEGAIAVQEEGLSRQPPQIALDTVLKPIS
jgi:hypothetical protein